MKKIFYLSILLLVFFIPKASTFGDSSQMDSYCYSPPSVTQDVKPNVLFVMDFSGSMQFPTYVPCAFSVYDNNKVAQCNSSSANYDKNKTYYGYFDPNKCYEYSSSFFQEKNCDCSNKIGTSSCISGNLLNWITTTRIDVARKVLTGGRSNTAGGSTFLESEGAKYIITDSSLKCQFTISASETTKRRLTISNSEGSCPLGNNSISNANIKIKPSDPSSIKGIIHSFCDTSNLDGQINEKCKIIMEFMVFASNSRYGEIKVGKNATIASLISAINNETPYQGTPTGEALWEAYDYYKQSNEHSYADNNTYINKGNGNFDPYYDGSGNNSISVSCRKSFVLLLSDGAWNGNVDPIKPARVMHTTDLRDDLQGKQTVDTYAVYAFGDLDPDTKLEGRQAMITTAIFGGFDDKDSNTWPYPFSDYPNNSREVTYPLSQCNPSGTWNSSCSEWDTYNNSPKDGLPYNFYEADDGDSLKNAILNALLDILRRASSGSTVATLASRTGISSLVIQPYYYPKYQREDGTELGWLGFLRSFWIDLKQNLREDTVVNKVLDMAQSAWDKIIQFINTGDETKIAVLSGDTDSGSNACQLETIKNLNQAIPVFDSGCWLANIGANSRTIKYNKDGILTDFTTAAASDLANIWKNIDSTIDSTKAGCIIRYLRGEDLSNDSTCSSLPYVKRPRELNINSFCPNDTGTKTWKLGDIIHSNPSVVSDQPVNIYHIKYGDSSYSTFIKSDTYKNRPTIAFVGANDGMLHAFRAGTVKNQANLEKPSKLQNSPTDTGTDKIGREEWAFIPKNAIPYLIWYGKTDYCHVPTVDYRTLVFDAKVGGVWKTLLVGSMGFGGRAFGQFSSSVFVLDITDPLNPSLLWERALPDQTLTLSFPAVTKIKIDNNENWYVVVGTGPNYVTNKQTSFSSSPKIYFFNINDGSTAHTVDIPLPDNTSAAVGDIMPVDVDFDYYDDTIYFGLYGTKSGKTWGMFYRMVVKNGFGSPKEAVNLETFKTQSVNEAPPVFAAPAFTKDEYGNLWVFFGTGRYLTQEDKTISYNNYLIGFKDPCWDGSCSTTYSKTSLTDTTSITVLAKVGEIKKLCSCSENSCGLVDVVYETTSENPPEVTQGWYYELTGEAIISQPAIFGGIVDALSFVPPQDICAYQGDSNLFALYYKSGTPYPRPAVLSTSATSGTQVGQTVTVYAKISLGKGVPPLGNPFQIIQGPSSREYTKFTGSISTPINQQVAKGYESRFISWIEK